MPIYTYRCDEGHEWDEVRSYEGSETSEGPCATCLEERGGTACYDAIKGRKTPARMNPAFRGGGWTPKFFPNRKGK